MSNAWGAEANISMMGINRRQDAIYSLRLQVLLSKKPKYFHVMQDEMVSGFSLGRENLHCREVLSCGLPKLE